jgi:hypothetical protein
MRRDTIGRVAEVRAADHAARDGSTSRGGTLRWALGVLLSVSIGVSFWAILPLGAASGLLAVFAWAALPGVIVARRMYGSDRSAWPAALLVGPLWGFCLTSAVLLVLWVSGVRSLWLLFLAPAGGLIVAALVGRLAGAFVVPAIGRRDVAPILMVLLLVPLINGRPYARVGEMVPEGKAYRAYFIADFVWAMAVTSEVSKGDVPPHNPFLAGDRLHYYWLAHLLSAIEYRATRPGLAVEQVLLVNGTLLDLAFVAFLYFFVRHFVHSPPAAAVACVAAVLFTSFEGVQRLFLYWQRNVPLDGLRMENIDAISNWRFGNLKVDGLQRLLLYQPHHATAWGISLSALVVLLQARDGARSAVNLVAGVLLGLGVLLSSFLAAMVGTVVGIYQVAVLAARRRWIGLALGGLSGALPILGAIAVSSALAYVDASPVQLVYVGLNRYALPNLPTAMALSFGPILVAAAAGAVLAVYRRAGTLATPALMIAVAAFFYFYVDVIDHQHAYVGFRAGHLFFMASAPLVGFAGQELWGWRATRIPTGIVAGLLALGAAPTMIIDLYNTQDTSNRNQGPGFRWTEVVTRGEIEALEWIKRYTPEDALIQVEPSAHDSGTWAYMPAFGERRMTAGLPISMIPLQKYRDASARVTEVFRQEEAAKAYALAAELRLQYVWLGPVERARYPRLEQALDGAPYWFKPVFRNSEVSIYRVT